MAEDIKPVSHLEKVIAGEAEPVSHLEKVIAQYGGGGGSVTTNYNLLSNKPFIEGIELKGNKTLEQLGLLYEEDITTASTTWKLQHNLNTKTPTVQCLDNNNIPIGGEIDYKNATINYIEVTFCKPVLGKAIIRK